MPITVERTTQKPHAVVYTNSTNALALAVKGNTTTKASTVVSFLTVIESCEVPNRQERASDKRC